MDQTAPRGNLCGGSSKSLGVKYHLTLDAALWHRPPMTASTELRTRPGLTLPRPLRERWLGIQRDLRALGSGFFGDRPPVASARTGAGWSRRTIQDTGALARRTLLVAGIDRLTPDAVRIRLADPTGAPVLFRPGQFFTVCVVIEGVEHRRAYSLCSDPGQPAQVAIGVKRAGLVSSFLVEALQPGAALDILGPSGSYGLVLDPTARREVVLVAGGSGITPQLALAQGLLRQEPGTRVVLLYANRGLDDVMFAADLIELQAQFPERFQVHHVLEAPPAGFEGTVGRLDAAVAEGVIAALGRDEATWLLCGPAPMMEAVVGVLAARGVPAARIHQERFTAAPRSQAAATTPQPLLVRLGGTRIATDVAPGSTLLEAGLAARAAMPYSCALGGCGACKVRHIAGEVVMDEPNCLTERERAAGYLLACVARPVGPVEIEVVR